MSALDIQVGPALTGMCLVHTNLPLADHTHSCIERQAHTRHRCHCGSRWPAPTEYHGRTR